MAPLNRSRIAASGDQLNTDLILSHALAAEPAQSILVSHSNALLKPFIIRPRGDHQNIVFKPSHSAPMASGILANMLITSLTVPMSSRGINNKTFASTEPKVWPASVASCSCSVVALNGLNNWLTHPHTVPNAEDIPSQIGLSGESTLPTVENVFDIASPTGANSFLIPCHIPMKKAFIGSQNLYISNPAAAMPAMIAPMGFITSAFVTPIMANFRNLSGASTAPVMALPTPRRAAFEPAITVASRPFDFL